MSSSRLDAFLQEHYLDWYQYFSHYTHASPPNGSVYIVTGVDKARSWSIATFSLSSHDYKMTGGYTDGTWLGANILPNDSDGGSSGNENLNQCVFLRGTRISLGKFPWFENFDDPPDDEARYMVILHRPLPFLQRWFYKTNEALPESQYLSVSLSCMSLAESRVLNSLLRQRFIHQTSLHRSCSPKFVFRSLRLSLNGLSRSSESRS